MKMIALNQVNSFLTSAINFMDIYNRECSSEFFQLLTYRKWNFHRYFDPLEDVDEGNQNQKGNRRNLCSNARVGEKLNMKKIQIFTQTQDILLALDIS